MNFLNTVNENLQGTKDIKTVYPKTLTDVEAVIDDIKRNEILISIATLKQKDKQRFLDVLCGACYALNKGICPISKEIYLIVNKQ